MNKNLRSLLIITILGTLAWTAAVAVFGDPSATQPVYAGPGNPPTVVRVYDVRELLAGPGNYPLVERPPTTQPSGGDSGTMTASDLADLIKNNFSPTDWRDSGGDLASLEIIDGQLVVVNTVAVQNGIKGLLEQLSNLAARSVSVRAVWLSVTSRELAQSTKQDSGWIVFDPKSFEDIVAKSAVAEARLTCLDGQTVHISSGRHFNPATTEPFKYDEPIVPLWRRDGYGLQIKPVLRDDGTVKADVEIYWNDLYSTTETITSELATSAVLPLDKPIVVGGMTPQSSGLQPGAKQLFLVLEISATGTKKYAEPKVDFMPGS